MEQLDLLQKSSENRVRNLCETSCNVYCSMCGDVGFKQQLFKCSSCLLRYQHTYCSRFYPNTELDGLSCEWCIQAILSYNKTICKSKQANLQGRKRRKIKRRQESHKEDYSEIIKMAASKPQLLSQGGWRYKRLADF